jgi:ribosomal protein S24E
LGYVAVQCLKNNTGIAGGKEATVHLYANFERLTVYDKEYPLKLS